MLKIGKGVNIEVVRSSNKGAVLSYLNAYGPSSRKKIAEDLKLTTAALSIITNELIEDNMVVEIGEIKEKRAGRKKILIDLNEKARYCLGLEIQNKKIIFVISDMKANIIFEKEWNITKKFKQEDFFKIINFIEGKIEDIKDIILGIGILVPGEIKENIAISCPIPDILRIVEENLKIKTIIENNMIGLVISELYFKEKHNNFWVLKYGPGIGSSVVVDGTICRGTDNMPVEFGHIPLLKENSSNFCPICKKYSCLESEIHFDKIIEKFEKKGYKKEGEETDFKYIERISKIENYQELKKNIELLVDYFSLVSWIIPVSEVILTGEIFLNKKFFDYFIKKFREKKSNIKLENILSMKNYLHKRKIASCLLILEDFFKIY